MDIAFQSITLKMPVFTGLQAGYFGQYTSSTSVRLPFDQRMAARIALSRSQQRPTEATSTASPGA